MKRVNISSIIILILISIACSNGSRIQKVITGSNYKLWVKWDPEEAAREVTTYYYFNKNGQFQIYKKYKNNNEIEKLDMGDVMLIEEWNIPNNQSIFIAGNTYAILKLNDSTINLKNTNNNHVVNLMYKGDSIP